MKSGLILLLLYISVFVFGQSKSKVIRKTEIDIADVDHIRIGKFLKKPIYVISDSTYSMVYKYLDDEQIKHFIGEWNNSTYAGERKLKPKYCIEVNFKDKSRKVIKLNGTLNEIKRFCFQPKDKRFFKTLWKNAKEE